jgi:integrase
MDREPEAAQVKVTGGEMKRPPRPKGTGSIYRRGRVWWIRCEHGAKPESSGSIRKADAQELLDKRLAEASVGRLNLANVGHATYADLEGMLLADLRANGRRSVEDVERYRLPHLKAFFGEMRARDITYDVVTGYVARRMAHASASTVSYEAKLLSRMFKIAQRAGKVDRMPAFPTICIGDNARQGFCSPEEVERIIGHLPEHAKPIVRMLYITGWRTSEVVGLTWARVDFEAGMIRLDAAHSKSGKAREFPFGVVPVLVDLLHEQREHTSKLARERGRIIPQVFHVDGEPLASFRSAWRTAVKKAGLPGLRPHDLRRSAARNLVRAGVSEGVVMKLCGWTTRHMFDRYNVSDKRDLVDGVSRLNGFLEARTLRPQAAER